MEQETLNQHYLFGSAAYEEIQIILDQKKVSSVFILVDSNTHQNCLSLFLQKIETATPIEVIEIDAGEEFKTIETCVGIWKTLSELGADRKSLLINLGGGVVTDLGGFVAATFKRGISFIHVPTTLLAMVDAALGGKNGVNLDGLKNQVGVIHLPELVLLDPEFLATLPQEEMRSGLAEMLKHGLIADEDYWNKLSDLKTLDLSDLESLILRSVEIKQEVVAQDPTEKGLRKSLNFGHTLGHSIESYLLEERAGRKLLHGEAIAIGMVLAAFISHKLEDFPQKNMAEIKDVIVSIFGRVSFSKEDQDKIIELLKYDKKNEGGKINFVLLRKIGEPVIDREVPKDLLYQAFEYYLQNQDSEF